MFEESAKLLVWVISVVLLAVIILPQMIRILEKLVQAASMISAQPIALQLRFLQTMKEISSEHKTTTVLPIPINLFAPFIKRSESPTPKEP